MGKLSRVGPSHRHGDKKSRLKAGLPPLHTNKHQAVHGRMHIPVMPNALQQAQHKAESRRDQWPDQHGWSP